MKIQYMSDLHLEFEEGLRPHASKRAPAPFWPPLTDAAVIALAGDIWNRTWGVVWARDLAQAHGKPVVMVAGNHDYWAGSVKNRRSIEVTIADMRAAAGDGVHFLENDAVIIAGTRFLGCTLWTDYDRGNPVTMSDCAWQMNDFEMIAGKLRPQHLLDRHRSSVAWLDAELSRPHGGGTVVVTHHAPGFRPHGLSGDPIDFAYASELEWLVERHGPQIWIHGHLHKVIDYRIGDTRVLSNPRGYARFDPVHDFDAFATVDLGDLNTNQGG
jgi:predicted phosphodiesterase